jgi:hypothetical protein
MGVLHSLLTRELHADAEDIGVYADPAGRLAGLTPGHNGLISRAF